MSTDPPDNVPASVADQHPRPQRWPRVPGKNTASRIGSEATDSQRPVDNEQRENARTAGSSRTRFRWRPVLISWVLFTAFLTYFNLTSDHLRQGAGPDSVHNDDATNFIYENNRLAVLPDDEEQLLFTRYGGTRALRPPLAFVTSAYVARLFDPADTRELRKTFRKGSALLMSIAVVVCFLALWVYFENLLLATSGALIVGLMPQFSFIASYNNDDCSAIVAGSLMFMALVALFRRGINLRTMCLLGLASGITIISKQSAWILFPTVAIFLILFVLRDAAKSPGPVLLSVLIMLMAGGWWIAFNISNYGIDDPLLQKITRETADRHSRFSQDKVLGYQAHGVGMKELVVDNHDFFMTKTLRSTIGNLDWLRLPVGVNHYRFYLLLFSIGIVAWLLRMLALVLPGAPSNPRAMLFESILVFALLFQFAAYVWININNDIQTQGKYLLPVLLAALILSMRGLQSLSQLIARFLSFIDLNRFEFSQRTLIGMMMIGIGAVAMAMHYDALKSYILPYYRPAFYSPPLTEVVVGEFTKISLDDVSIGTTHQMNQIEFNERGGLKFTASGTDPWFIPDIENCAGAQDNSLLRVRINAELASTLAVYWDDGDGFSESNKSVIKYQAGNTELHVWIGPRACNRLRIDPSVNAGEFRINALGVATLIFNRRADRK